MKMDTIQETIRLTGNDAKGYFELDPDVELNDGDRVFVELDHTKKFVTWMIVPEGENPSNYVPQEDDYGAVVAWLIEHDYDSPSLRAARRAQLGIEDAGKKMVRVTITIREEQKALLEGHPEINFSGWVQKKIDEEFGEDGEEVA
jgi:hypothetical protein